MKSAAGFRIIAACVATLSIACRTKPPVQRADTAIRVLTLSIARATLQSVEAGRRRIGDRLGGILLDGYDFSREISVSKAGTVIVISTNNGGGVLLFKPDGSYAASKPIGRPTSVQVFDLDDDGISELVLDEVNGRGTGVLHENYHLYEFDHSNIKEPWSGESFISEWPDSAPDPEKEHLGLLSFRPAAYGQPSRLIHVVLDELTGKESRRVWCLRSGRMSIVSGDGIVPRSIAK